MSVGRICRREVHVAGINETAEAAARRMKERSLGTLLVVNDSREPIGILTDRDLVTRVVAERRDPRDTRLEEIMTLRPKTISEDSPVEAAIALMGSGGFRRLPVVNQAGKLLGILSLDDLLSALVREFTDMERIFEKEAPPLKVRFVAAETQTQS